MIESLNQYQSVVSHGLNLLCALSRERHAIYIPLLDFYNALCIKACTLCCEFGKFISLLTWKPTPHQCIITP
jgi:hypothetical protein